jgi:hypothetical protein
LGETMTNPDLAADSAKLEPSQLETDAYAAGIAQGMALQAEMMKASEQRLVQVVVERAKKPLLEIESEMQHFGGAECYESDAEDGRDPDNCQRCGLLEIIDFITLLSSPENVAAILEQVRKESQ